MLMRLAHLAVMGGQLRHAGEAEVAVEAVAEYRAGEVRGGGGDRISDGGA
jgi:hypothetical protein